MYNCSCLYSGLDHGSARLVQRALSALLAKSQARINIPIDLSG